MYRICLLFALFLFNGQFVSAQLNEVLRKEIEQPNYGLKLVPFPTLKTLGKFGLLVAETRVHEGGGCHYDITQYDKGFQIIKSVSIELPFKNFETFTVLSDDSSKVYILLTHYKKYVLISYSSEDQRYYKLESSFPAAFPILSDLQLINGQIIGIANVRSQDNLLFLDLNTGISKFQKPPGSHPKRKIASIVPDQTQNRFAVFVHDGINVKLSDSYFTFLNEKGEQLTESMLLDEPKDRVLIDYSITWIDSQKFLLAGTYATSAWDESASGMYFAEFNDYKQQFISFYSFSELENYYDYLPEKKQERKERKAEQKREKGKEDFVETRIAFHPVITADKQYILVGEAYVASTSHLGTDPSAQSANVFDGYQYTHAIVLYLDFNGQKLYDHCFSMNLTYKPFEVIYNLRVDYDDNTLKMLCCDGSALKGMSIEDGVASEVVYGELPPQKEEGTILWNQRPGCTYWYENYYIVYGTLHMKDAEADKKYYQIFYFSKLAY